MPLFVISMRSSSFSLCSNLALSAGNTPPEDEILVAAEIFLFVATTTGTRCFSSFSLNSNNSSSTFSKYFFASSCPSSISNANLKSLLASSKHSTRLDTVIFSESVFLANTAPLATYASTCFESNSIARSNAFNAIIKWPRFASFTPVFVASRAHPHFTFPRISLSVNSVVFLPLFFSFLFVILVVVLLLFLRFNRFLSFKTTGNPKCLKHSLVACCALNSKFFVSRAVKNGILLVIFSSNVSIALPPPPPPIPTTKPFRLRLGLVGEDGSR
mmetsp:Transcript_6241/g.19605  ORF Transcript_6241/g.19605 Transcript_6241/m.19605 type:complete len:272 (-) Transcript_6241:267-1082(-)